MSIVKHVCPINEQHSTLSYVVKSLAQWINENGYNTRAHIDKGKKESWKFSKILEENTVTTPNKTNLQLREVQRKFNLLWVWVVGTLNNQK